MQKLHLFSRMQCIATLPSAAGLIYYRAMHYSAKRGLAIACRLSVLHLSVCDVGGS